MARGLERLGQVGVMLRNGQLAELVDQVSSRLMPAGNPVLYWDRFVVVALDPGQARAPTRIDRIPVVASLEDIEALCRARPDRSDLFRRRLSEGQRCLVIHEGGRIVARMWVVGDRPVHETNSGFRFVAPARPALWCHDIFVEPSHRRRGLFAALMWGALEREPDRRPHLYGEIHHLNHASLRAHQAFGHRVNQTVTVVSVLGLKVFGSKDPRGNTSVRGHHSFRVRHV
jgi:GNAT superfamily N-acetyltransferase